MYYDGKSKNLPKLIVGQPVRVKTKPQIPRSEWQLGKVVAGTAPRRYQVELNGTKFERNRIHTRDSSAVPVVETVPVDAEACTPSVSKPDIPCASPETPCSVPTVKPVVSPTTITTKSGRVVKPSPKYKDYVNYSLMY